MTRIWRTSATHRVGRGTVARLTPALPPAGLLLGGPPGVVCPWFTHRGAVRVALVGGTGVTAHVVLRALGMGAVVVVRTDRPHRWDRLVSLVDLPRDLMSVVPPGADLHRTGTASCPLLVVDEVTRGEPPEEDGTAPAGDRGGWRCDLTSTTAVTRATLDRVRAADVVLVDPAGAGDLQALVGVPSARALPRAGDLAGPGRVWVLAGDVARSFDLPDDVVGGLGRD